MKSKCLAMCVKLIAVLGSATLCSRVAAEQHESASRKPFAAYGRYRYTDSANGSDRRSPCSNTCDGEYQRPLQPGRQWSLYRKQAAKRESELAERSTRPEK